MGARANGPRGEKMRNSLEVDVAKILSTAGLGYQYEKMMTTKNPNGFISVDFFLEKPPLIIEATRWDNPKEKSGRLKRKFEFLRKKFPKHAFAVVTTAALCERYKSALPSDVWVLGVGSLERFLADKLEIAG